MEEPTDTQSQSAATASASVMSLEEQRTALAAIQAKVATEIPSLIRLAMTFGLVGSALMAGVMYLVGHFTQINAFLLGLSSAVVFAVFFAAGVFYQLRALPLTVAHEFAKFMAQKGVALEASSAVAAPPPTPARLYELAMKTVRVAVQPPRVRGGLPASEATAPGGTS